MLSDGMSAVEKLAEEEIQRRDEKAYKKLLKPVRESQREREKRSAEWTRRANEIMQEKLDQQKAMEEAKAREKAEQEIRKPEELKDAYRVLLRGVK